MSDIKSAVREQYDEIFESLGVNPSDEDIDRAYEEEQAHWNSLGKDFEPRKEDISYDEDFILARNLILKSLDKTEKVLDAIFNLVSVNPTPLMLELGAESAKNLQTSAKNLTELHSTYQNVKQKRLKNKKEEAPEEEDKNKFEDKHGNKLSFEE